MLHRRSGFTLIEVMLAVAIAIIISLLALPSLRGMNKERELQESFDRFDALARKAQANAVTQQRGWTLKWDERSITLTPDSLSSEEMEQANLGGEAVGDSIAITEDESFILERPVSLLPPKDTPAEWTFWRSGTCEPAIIKYTGPAGSWVAQYNPLTGHGEITEQRLP